MDRTRGHVLAGVQPACGTGSSRLQSALGHRATATAAADQGRNWRPAASLLFHRRQAGDAVYLYVPTTYKPGTKMPLVVALHGYNGNHDYFFALVNNLPELCEQYGFIFVAPLGYTLGGWYGAPLSVPPGGGKGKTKGPAQTPEEAQRERDLSEKDVMNVVDLVTREYSVDSDRTFLMGHSMGGMGTYFLGQKYAGKWAAIAPMSGTMAGVDYHLDRLNRVWLLWNDGSGVGV